MVKGKKLIVYYPYLKSLVKFNGFKKTALETYFWRNVTDNTDLQEILPIDYITVLSFLCPRTVYENQNHLEN